MKKACTNIKEILPFLKIISDENRLKILCHLKQWEKCVNHIVKDTNLAQNLVSHHLRKMKEAWIIISKKHWLYVRYSINYSKIDIYLDYFKHLFI